MFSAQRRELTPAEKELTAAEKVSIQCIAWAAIAAVIAIGWNWHPKLVDPISHPARYFVQFYTNARVWAVILVGAVGFAILVYGAGWIAKCTGHPIRKALVQKSVTCWFICAYLIAIVEIDTRARIASGHFSLAPGRDAPSGELVTVLALVFAGDLVAQARDWMLERWARREPALKRAAKRLTSSGSDHIPALSEPASLTTGAPESTVNDGDIAAT